MRKMRKWKSLNPSCLLRTTAFVGEIDASSRKYLLQEVVLHVLQVLITLKGWDTIAFAAYISMTL